MRALKRNSNWSLFLLVPFFLIIIILSAETANSEDIPLGEALDNASLIWTTGGDVPWFGQTDISYYDGDAARSGVGEIHEHITSWLETTVTGPGILTFYLKPVTYRSKFDTSFYIDGKYQKRLGYTVDWERTVYLIEAGDHTLRWVFSDILYDEGDGALLDKVGFITEPAIVVESPNGGETWEQRSVETIRWFSMNAWSSHVRIELHKGDMLYDIITPSSANYGSRWWFIPFTLPPATDYWIRVVSTSDPSVYDDSDGYFEITETETSPLDGYLILRGDNFAGAEDHPELDIGVESGESFTIEGWYYETGYNAGYSSSPDMDSFIFKANSYYLGFGMEYLLSGLDPGEYRLFGCIEYYIYLYHLNRTCIRYNVPYTDYSAGWHHVALVGDGSQVRLYIDGELKNEGEYVGPLNNTLESLIVGTAGRTPRVPRLLDEIRISDMARYTGTSFNPHTSPFTCDEHTRALWHFDEPEGAIQFSDACGANNVLFKNCTAALGGDVDGDGNVSLMDAVLALQVIAGMEPASKVCGGADVNADGQIGMEEVIYVLQKVAGLR